MQSKATTVEEYLAELPAERREALEVLRATINANRDPLLAEGMQYGMIGYFVPHAIYPAGYHCDPKEPLPFGGLASQKGHLSLYLLCLYAHDGRGSELLDWFRGAWTQGGRKLDMGKACIRFKRIEDVPLDVVGEVFHRVTVKKFVAVYEASREGEKLRKATGNRAKC